MLNEFRLQPVTWDRVQQDLWETFLASEGDSNGRGLRLQIVNRGDVQNLSGAVVKLTWRTKNGSHHGSDTFTEVDGQNGIFEITFTEGMLSNVGVLIASLVLTYDSMTIESNSFIIEIKQSSIVGEYEGVLPPIENPDPEPDPEPKLDHNINTEGLIIYYDFGRLSNGDPDSTYAENLIGDTLHGEMRGFTFNSNSGYVEHGLLFDGSNDRIDIPHTTSITELTKYSVEVVVTPRDGIGYHQSNVWTPIVYLDDGVIELGYGEPGYWEFYTTMRGGGSINRTDMHQKDRMEMATVVFDGNSLKLYRRGQLVNTSNSGATLNITGDHFVLGGANDWGYMNGVISSFRLYDRALTDSEVQANYQDELSRYPIGTSI